MTQTNVLLSGVSSSKISLGENKGTQMLDGSEQEGDGFLAQLAQFISGEGEFVEGETTALGQGILTQGKIEGLTDESSVNALLEQGDIEEGAQLDPQLSSGQVDAGALTSKTQSEFDERALKSLDGIKADEGLISEVDAAKQDRETLLQRLNESSNALQTQNTSTTQTSNAKESVRHDGKALPLDPNAAIGSDIILPVSLKNINEALAKEINGDIPLKTNLFPEALHDSAPLQALSEEAALLEKMALDQIQNIASGKGSDEGALSDGDLLLAKDLKGLAQLQDETNESAVIKTPAQGSGFQGDGLQGSGLQGSDLKGSDLQGAGFKDDAPSQMGVKGETTHVTPLQAGSILTTDAAGVHLDQNALAQSDALPESSLAGFSALQTQAPSLVQGQSAMQSLPDAQNNPLMNEFSASRQHAMNQAATAVHTVLAPSAQSLQQSNVASAFASIPWTPAALQTQDQSKSHGVALDTLMSPDQKFAAPEAKADQFAQQLATSLGNQGATTAARLDNAVTQTPLQLSQNQAEAAEALSEKVNIMMSKNLKYVDIRLDPPELGKMQIKLSMNQDQASVQFTVSNQGVREMVEQSLPRLREMMQQQGVQLSQSSVQQEDAGGRQGFTENQAQQGKNQLNQERSSRFDHGENEQNMELNTINHEFNVSASKDRVDYYA